MRGKEGKEAHFGVEQWWVNESGQESRAHNAHITQYNTGLVWKPLWWLCVIRLFDNQSFWLTEKLKRFNNKQELVVLCKIHTHTRDFSSNSIPSKSTTATYLCRKDYSVSNLTACFSWGRGALKQTTQHTAFGHYLEALPGLHFICSANTWSLASQTD